MIGLIVAVDNNNLMALNGTIPWYKPKDLKRFKEVTQNSNIVVGRKTLDTIPEVKGCKLPTRTVWCITRDLENKPSYSNVFYIQNMLPMLLDMIDNSDKDVWIIGGAQIYQQALDTKLVDRIDLTKVNMSVEIKDGDVPLYFHDFSKEFNLTESKVNPEDPELTHTVWVR